MAGNVHGSKGQALVEYVIALFALLVVVVVMGYLLQAAKNSTTRTMDLIGSDYP